MPADIIRAVRNVALGAAVFGFLTYAALVAAPCWCCECLWSLCSG